MSRMIPIKKNFYKDGVGSGEIAMPPLDEKPPVLDATEWAGNNQQQVQEEVAPVQEQEIQEQEVEEIEEEEVEEQEEAPAPQFKNKSQENNFKALRERAEKAERQNDELMKYVLEAKRSEQPQQKQQIQEPEVEEDFDFSVDDDALIEGKQAKRLAAELKKMKQQMKAFQSQSQESVIETKIKSAFPDFDEVVSKANVKRLNEEYPEIAATLRDTKDLYSKATAAYKIMRKFGIYEDRRYEEDKMKAVKNATKPRPLTSVNPQQGDSPLSKANAFANGMSKDLQAQLLKEMAAARRNL